MKYTPSLLFFNIQVDAFLVSIRYFMHDTLTIWRRHINSSHLRIDLRGGGNGNGKGNSDNGETGGFNSDESMEHQAAVKATAAAETAVEYASASVKRVVDQTGQRLFEEIRAARLKGYEGDMCSECGQFTMVRNGTCLKCDTCGATSGCS